MIIFSPYSVLGKVRTVPYIQIYTKLTINHRVHFFNLLKSGQATVLHINVLFSVDFSMVEKNSGFDIG